MSWKWWRLVVNTEEVGETVRRGIKKKVEVMLESVDEAIIVAQKLGDSIDIYISAPEKPYTQPPLALERFAPSFEYDEYTAYGVFKQNANMDIALQMLGGVKKTSSVVVHYIIGEKRSYYEVYLLSESERTVAMLRTKLLKTKKIPPKKIYDAIRKRSVIGKGEKIEKPKLFEKIVFNPTEHAVVARTLPPYVPWITYKEFVKLLKRKR